MRLRIVLAERPTLHDLVVEAIAHCDAVAQAGYSELSLQMTLESILAEEFRCSL